MTSESKRCSAIRQNGQPCAAPGSFDGLCFAHAPSMDAARARARQRGGRNSAKAVRLRSLCPPRLTGVYDILEAALTDVIDGSLEPKRAQAAASLARAMVAVLVSGETEERLRQVEQVLNDSAHRTG